MPGSGSHLHPKHSVTGEWNPCQADDSARGGVGALGQDSSRRSVKPMSQTKVGSDDWSITSTSHHFGSSLRRNFLKDRIRCTLFDPLGRQRADVFSLTFVGRRLRIASLICLGFPRCSAVDVEREGQQCAEWMHRPCGRPFPVCVSSMVLPLVCGERGCSQEDRTRAYGRGRT